MNELTQTQLLERVTPPTARANPRVQQIVARMLGDLFKAIDDLDISPTNSGPASTGCRAGRQRPDWACSPPAWAWTACSTSAPTKPTNAPASKAARRAPSKGRCTSPARRCRSARRALDEGSDEHRGETLFMQGRVFDVDGKPVAGAKVDVWHANLLGSYSFFDPDQADVQPAPQDRDRRARPLPVPQHPAAGLRMPAERHDPELLDLLGRHGKRPAHIHFFVIAPGQRTLTTQINIDGDNYL